MSYLTVLNDLRKALSDRERATEYGHCTETESNFFLEDEQRAVNISHDGDVWTARLEDYGALDA